MVWGSVLDCSKRGQHRLTGAQPTENNCLRSVIMCVVADDLVGNSGVVAVVVVDVGGGSGVWFLVQLS